MKILKLSTAILIITVQVCIAQQIKWGQTKKHTYLAPNYSFSDEKNLYITFWKKNYLHIEKYDKQNFKRIYSIKHKIDKNHFGLSFTKIDNNLIYVKGYYDKKTKKEILYRDVFSTETGEKIVDQKTFLTFDANKGKGITAAIISKNKNRLLITHSDFYEQNKTDYKFYAKLFDENFNLIAERKWVNETYNGDQTILGFTLDNEGSIYQFKKNNKGNYFIECLESKNDFEKWEEPVDFSKMDLPASFEIFNMRVAIDEKGDYNIIGFYSKKLEVKFSITYGNSESLSFEEEKPLDGILYLKVDHVSKNIITSHVSHFDDDFKKTFKTKSDIKKNKEGKIRNMYENMQIYPKLDGSFVIAAESYRTIFSSDSYTHLVKDVLVFNLGTDGSILWKNRIPKYQRLVYGSLKMYFMYHKNKDFLSFYGTIDNENFIMLHNDNTKNFKEGITQNEVKSLKKFDKSIAVANVINMQTGLITKSIIDRNKGFTIAPIYSHYSTSTKEIIVYSRNKNKYRFGKIVY